MAGFLLIIQPGWTDNDAAALAPQIICGGMDPQFSYAKNNLDIELNKLIDQRSNHYSFFSTSQIIPLIIEDPSTTIMTRNFMGCGAINSLSEAEIVSNSDFKNIAIKEICGDAFSTPITAVNLLNSALQNHVNLYPQNHMVVSSFKISEVSGSNDTVLKVVTGQNFTACASIVVSS